jgi:hypothetical protein
VDVVILFLSAPQCSPRADESTARAGTVPSLTRPRGFARVRADLITVGITSAWRLERPALLSRLSAPPTEALDKKPRQQK